jgi:Transposase DDE domain
MQFTRFLRNRSVTASEMSRHAGEQTSRRVAGREVVAIQDTSELALGGRRARTAGYGPVGKGGKVGGLLLHPVLAVEVGSEALLGLVSMQVWNRTGGKRPSRRGQPAASKESQRWIDGMRRASEVLAQASSITVLCDGEGDMYGLFAQRAANLHLIVRTCQNRCIDTPSPTEARLLFDLIDGQAEQGRFEVEVPAAPGRSARMADLAVRFVPAVVCRPCHGAGPNLPETVTVNLVEVRETTPPADGSKPIHWRLTTTHEVTDLAQARHVVDLYRLRWTIEEFFSTLKTAGFDIEAADISEPTAMINFVAAATIAAVTVKQLVQARDGTTCQHLSDAFEAQDQPLLEALSAKLEGKTVRQRNLHPKGSLAFAAWVIARLGGWTGYYGKPGPKIMRIGLADFRAIKYGHSMARQNV